MSHLAARDRELVSLGAALASNCVPCIEHHIPQARSAGLKEEEISEAIEIADRVRQHPAYKVLEVALKLMSAGPAPKDAK